MVSLDPLPVETTTDFVRRPLTAPRRRVVQSRPVLSPLPVRRSTVDLAVIGVQSCSTAAQTEDHFQPLFASVEADDFYVRHLADVHDGHLPAMCDAMPAIVAFLRRQPQATLEQLLAFASADRPPSQIAFVCSLALGAWYALRSTV